MKRVQKIFYTTFNGQKRPQNRPFWGAQKRAKKRVFDVLAKNYDRPHMDRKIEKKPFWPFPLSSSANFENTPKSTIFDHF
jgi:hypothetical protein